MSIIGITNQRVYKNQYNSKQTDKTKRFSINTDSKKNLSNDNNADVIGFANFRINASTYQVVVLKYAEESTEDNPIIELTRGIDGDTLYKVNINEVDSSTASEAEMAALCSYLDDKGITSRSTFGSYAVLQSSKAMGIHNKFTSATNNANMNEDIFFSEQVNWDDMIKRVADLVFKCKDMAQYIKVKDVKNALLDHKQSFTLFS